MTNRLKAGLFCVVLFLLIVFRGSSGPPMQFAPFMMKYDVTTDWARRVVANGGAMPSQTSIIAMETLRVSLEAQGLTNKIWTLCIFVPDSVIAASTPLIKNLGADPWTNSGTFVAGDLNIQGLKSDGVKYLDTAISNNVNVLGTNLGFSVIVTEAATNGPGAVIMNQGYPGGFNTAQGLFPSGSGADQVFMGIVTAGNILTTNDLNRVGYLSGNKDGTNTSLYVASPIESHKLLSRASPTGASLFNAAVQTSFAFWLTKIQGTNSGGTAFRLSMACIHNGFTETESSNFWWAVKTCRESLGGGTGDPIWQWARDVTNFGGAAISVNTSNALRTFRQGLDTDSLLYKMIAVNPLVPDNLTAARMPIVWQGGLQLWTNTAFGESNLTVNGLTGNGTTKYLGTGLNPAVLGYAAFGSSNAGVSTLVYTNPAVAASGGEIEFGGAGSSASSSFGLQIFQGTIYWYCWKFININTNYMNRVSATGGTNTSGFFSGNRTASNAFAFYWVTNNVHNVATNSTVLETSGTPTITNMFAFANAAPAGVGSFSTRTVSFMALHSGLTQTENSNLWYRVAILRTNLGGGVP